VIRPSSLENNPDATMNNPATILTVDDDESVRKALAAYLRDSGFETVEAATGGQGLALFHQERPDAVLCDLRLPDMDGMDVLSVIVRTSPRTPVIVVSATSVIGEVVQALQKGAWDFLGKPIDDMGVVECSLRRSLARAELERANRDYQRALEATNWQLNRSLEQLKQDEEAGQKIQQRLLPAEDARIGPFRFRRRQFPSMYLCGDFVDYFAIGPRHTGFYMTDVSGHDAASAFVTVMLKTLVRKYLDVLLQDNDDAIPRPERILQQLNRDLIEQELGKYCTMFFGVLDHETNTLIYAGAGQLPYPVMMKGMELRPLTARSRPIGLFEDAVYQAQTCELPENFGLVLVSDGVLELLPRDTARTRMQNFLQRLHPEPDLDAIVKGFRMPEGEPLPDDVTFLLVTREPVYG